MKGTRIGILGARGDSRGLAHQTAAFAKFLNPARVLGFDLTADNQSPYPCTWDDYGSCNPPCHFEVWRRSEITEEKLRGWLKGLDVVLGAETFYHPDVVSWARTEGVTTVLQINPEFAPWYGPDPSPPERPDVLVSPTMWHLERLHGVHYLPFPVDREKFPFRLRTTAETFVHVAGHRAMGDRAGSKLVMQDLPFTWERKRLVVMRTQSGFDFESSLFQYARVEKGNIHDPLDLYQNADVLVQPRRYGGQSLVVNEALSCGVPVIALDRIPERSWDGVFTIPCHPRGQLRAQGGRFDFEECNRGQVADAIESFASGQVDITEWSQAADSHAERISWNKLLPVYMDFLRAVARGENHVHVLRQSSSVPRPSSPDLAGAS